jgi:hypothetical protein
VASNGTYPYDIVEHVEVRGGSSPHVPVTVPTGTAPCRPRVVTDVDSDFGGWRARGVEGGWAALEADGTVPIDLATQPWKRLEIEHPDGRRWRAELPAEARDGHEIRLVLDGPRYEGLLLDRADGTPLAGVLVITFAPDGPHDAEVSPASVTDADGRFTISCEHPVPHTLSFHEDPERGSPHAYGSEFEGVRFVLEDPPSTAPRRLEVRVPHVRDGALRGLGEKRLSGRVVRAGGEAVGGADVWVFSVFDDVGGRLEHCSHASHVTSAKDGGYELILPEADRYRVSVYPEGVLEAALSEEWAATPGDERRQLALP